MLSFVAAALWTVEALLGLSTLADPQMRPDGGAYAYVLNGTVVRAELPDGKAVAVGKGTRPRWSADGKQLAYLSGGKVMVGGKPVGSGVTAFAWVGRDVAYLATDDAAAPDPEVNRESARFGRLYVGGKQVSGAQRHVISFVVSPDGKRAALAVQRTPKPEDIFHVDLVEVDLATRAETPLVSQPGRDGEPGYSPDGKWVVFHSQCGSLKYFNERQVGMVASGGGTVRYLTRGLPVDVFRNGNAYAWSADGTRMIFTAGVGTRDELWQGEVASGKGERLAEGVAGAASFSADLRRAVFLKTDAAHPAEIVLWEGGKERTLTRVFAGLGELPTVSSEVVRWKAGDGLEVEGVLWLPFGFRAGTKVPVLVELHGGPTGVALTAFPNGRTYPTVAFLQSGFAVFAPNFRGSSNYGEAFRKKNTLAQGVGDLDDVMTGIDELVRRGVADPDKLGVMGWSYGGFLTGSTIAQTRRFKGASVGAPTVDWAAYYGLFEGAREVLWTYFGGTPWEVPENYARHSYWGKLKDITTPTMLQIGALDMNFTAPIYQALRDRGVPVENVVYPREGHGIGEGAHQRDLMERNLRWMERWVR